MVENRILTGSKRLKKSLALFLSLVFVLELVLQVVPVQKVFAIDYSGIGNNYYEGGYNSYTGIDRNKQPPQEVTVTRKDIERDMGFGEYITIGYTDYYLNVELAVDYRKAVYGLPTDVKANDQEWKESSIGYWFFNPSTGVIVPVKDISNPPQGAIRVVFKYMGYGPDKQPVEDPYWPDESIKDLTWDDLRADTILPISDEKVNKSYSQLLASNTLASIKDSRTLERIFTEIINGTIMRSDGSVVGKLRNYSTSPTINGRYSYELIKKLSGMEKGKVNISNYKNYIVLQGSPKELYVTAYFFFLNPRNNKVYAVGFSGAIGKFLPLQYKDAPELSDVQTVSANVIEVKGITPDGEEINLPKKDGKYWLDKGRVRYVKVTFSLRGKFFDAHDILSSSNALDWWYTRENVTKWQTVVGYLRLSYTQNGKIETEDLTYDYIYLPWQTGEERYKETQKVDRLPDTVYWTGDWLTIDNQEILIPTDRFQLGTNTLQFAGKVRVYFTAGYHTDALNSKGVNVQFLVTGLPKPNVQATVTPQDTVIAKYNNQYFLDGNVLNPATIDEKVGITANVDESQLFPGVKVDQWEFKVYKKHYDNTQYDVHQFTVSAKDLGVDDLKTVTINPEDGKTTFKEDVTKISLGSTYTPAYYVEVRYHTSDGRWSPWGSTYTSARISVIEPLRITKIVQPQTIKIGDTATFTIVLQNLTSMPIQNVSLYDSLTFKTLSNVPTTSKIVSIVSTDPPFASMTDSNTGLWYIGTVEPNATLTLTVTVKGLKQGKAINTVRIMGSTNGVASATLTVLTDLPPELEITKTVDKPEIFIGEEATFTITLKNVGLGNVQNIVVKDKLLPPEGTENTLSIVSVKKSTGNFDINSMTWTIDKLEVDQTAYLAITVRALPFEDTYKDNTKLFFNMAEIDQPQPVKVSSVYLLVKKPQPDIRITKTVTPSEINVGETATFTVTVSNAAPNIDLADTTAKNVVVIDQLTQTTQNSSVGLSIQDYRASKGNAYITTTGGTWNIGDLKPGESATLTITVRAVGKGTFTNTAWFETDPSKRASATLVCVPPAEGNLTINYVAVLDTEGKPVNTIDKPMQVRVIGYFSSLFDEPGTVTLRLYINGILYSTLSRNISAFDNWQTDFGYYWVYGASTIAVTINYAQPQFMGDDDGTNSSGQVNPWIEKFNGKLETHYSDNVWTKTITGRYDIVSPDGGLYVDFKYNGYDYDTKNNIWRAKVGDTISVTNLSWDTNYTYNYVGRNWYDYNTATYPPPSYSYAGKYEVATLLGQEQAKYSDTFEWWLPDVYGSVPYNGYTLPAFTTIKIAQPQPSKWTGETVTAYHHAWDIESQTYSRYVWVEDGYWTQKSYGVDVDNDGIVDEWYWYWDWVHTGWHQEYNPIISPVYKGIKNTPINYYPVYNLITFSDYVPKRYSDDKWQLESAPSYDMYILLTAYDYYTGWAPYPQGYQQVVSMTWAYQVEHFAYAYKPLRVYYNNKPVAYFTVINAVNNSATSNDASIRIQDLSYDPDNDPVVEYEWEVDGQKFNSISELETFLNTTVKLRPGWHVISLKVRDDPTGRYYRLESKWSEVYQKAIYIQGNPERFAVSYKAKITFDRDVVYTMYHKSAPEYAIDPKQHSYVKVHVEVSDIGYWTYHSGVNGDKILEFKPLKVTNVLQPYTRLIRYKSAGILDVQPVRFENVKVGYNSFSYDAYFMYPKAGRYNLDERTDSTTMGIPAHTQDSKMVFPFEVESLGLVETLIKDHFAVNAFNPTFADPPGEDRTKFYSIAGEDDGNINHLDLGVKITDHSIFKDGKCQYIAPDPAMSPQPWIGYKKEKINDPLTLEIDRQIYPY